MKKEQTSLSDLFGEVKDANEINIMILDVIDSFGTPKTAEETEKLAESIANLIAKEMFNRLDADQKIGINLEFIGDKPRFEIYKLIDSCCG